MMNSYHRESKSHSWDWQREERLLVPLAFVIHFLEPQDIDRALGDAMLT